MTYSACNIDIDLPDEEAAVDFEDCGDAEYEDWLADYYSDWADFYQQVSDAEDAFRHNLIVKNYEFQARGGFLPGDTVMAEVEPGYWHHCTVLLVGISTLVVSAERSTTVQVITQLNTYWLD
ncbi:hypothetical protein NIES2135_48080 [Leptolyngbya boryana NIES-2135]|jgi:hypothetical protein|uniref:Uncharacterized protein n=1 Tax=Leptolyngbya boryana NIES-2135 TaxID=1973484 RepID=A0A1Z4JME9_LEPBY|nr:MULTISPECIES: hypothetical protein [Leptolyngbya]BAY57935.1 hypothetical protein NIES2135_48080 [Leptolyngbya boryana NIES-2135]MBD2367380.1 hypothetical protein [Leptolyngbya sp. FACHB-161]MBD2373904.1 hypothetical protein [Leptolyngbya sp. FACHB-238]MBD2398296.1 hypothetical protein [Leptolyngbya sp. FACHB-239]MBD2404207.1 hypothetical protein [Leptolyngbya sp. FACHB-402]